MRGRLGRDRMDLKLPMQSVPITTDIVSSNFQQYFSYIVAVSFLLEETEGPGENHLPVASH
jgi:hypothetical protein